jgi:hypothetical protein
MDKGSRKTPGSRILLPRPKTDETHNGQRQQKSRNTVKLAAFALGVAYKSCCEKAAEISKYAKRNLLTKPSRRNQLVFCQQVSYGIVMSQ